MSPSTASTASDLVEGTVTARAVFTADQFSLAIRLSV